MTYYAILDTNVLVSAMLRMSSVPGQLLSKALIGEIVPVFNDDIISEYREVLKRPKFHFDANAVGILLSAILERGLHMDASELSTDDVPLPDPKDIVFYQVTLSAREVCDAYLVTGNAKHFPVKAFVVSPREMLDIINKG